MESGSLRRTAALMAAGLFMAAAALAQEAPKPPDAEPAEADSSSALQGWQVFVGFSNLWPDLEESEGEIDRQINNGLGRLFPRWEEPTTFADWRDDLRLADFQVGIGREIAPKLDWYAVVGGATGRITNDARYFPLGLPIKLNIDFERTEWFTATGLDYYPWGKPELDEDDEGILAHVRAAKPFIEGGMIYLDLKATCDVGVDLPLVGGVGHYQEETRYKVLGFSPRLGLEIPLSEHNSVAFISGVTLFTTHGDEFDNVISCTVLRHRF